jgi:hypothetical protein
MVILQIAKTQIELHELDNWDETTLSEHDFSIKRKIEEITALPKRMKLFKALHNNEFTVLNNDKEVIFEPKSLTLNTNINAVEINYIELNLLELCELNDKFTLQLELVNYHIGLLLDTLESNESI